MVSVSRNNEIPLFKVLQPLHSLTLLCRLPNPSSPDPHTSIGQSWLNVSSTTPLTPSIFGANRFDAGSCTFVLQTAAKTTVKKADGTKVSLENLTRSTPAPSTPAVLSPQSSVLRQGSPGTPNRRPMSICMETDDPHKSQPTSTLQRTASQDEERS
jgi:translation initiation factor 4G